MASGSPDAAITIEGILCGSPKPSHRWMVEFDDLLRLPGNLDTYTRALRAAGLAKRADVLEGSFALGITHPSRISPDSLAKIIDARSNPNISNQPTALVFYPRKDNNNAFYGAADQIDTLIENGFKVLLYEVANHDDIRAALADSQSASGWMAHHLIVLAGHGSPKQTSFGAPDPAKEGIADRNNTLTVLDMGLMQKIGRHLIPRGTVIFLSCSTGQGGKTGLNMATSMRKAVPHAGKIYAPQIPVGANDLRLELEGRNPSDALSPKVKFAAPFTQAFNTKVVPTGRVLT